jgi:hypothetical protein
MATNSPGGKGQLHHTNQVHYVARTITFADDDVVKPIGILPAGAVVVDCGCVVTTAFSSGSVLDLGTSNDPDCFGSALVMTTAGRIKDVSSDPLLANDDYSATSDVTLVASLTSSGAIEAGSGVVWFEYVIPDRNPY